MTLQPSVNLALNFDKAQKKWRFAIFQAHAQSNNVTLSLNARYEYGLTVTGSDVALLFPLPIADISYPFYLRSDNNHSSYCADVIAVPYEDGGESNQNKEYYHFMLKQRFPEVIGLIPTWNSENLFSLNPSPFAKQLSLQPLKI